MRRTPVRLLAVPVLLGAVAAGCSSGKVQSTGDTIVDPTTTGGSGPTATSEEVVTDGVTTTSRRSGGGSTTTRADTTTSIAGSATTTAGGAGPVVLRAGGAGPTSFGTATDSAIASLSKSLGPVTRDLKNPGSSCPGPDRVTAWGRFSILSANGKVVGWTLDATPAGAPALKGPSGITTGSTVADLKKAFGSTLQLDDGGGSSFGSTFNVPAGAGLFGTLTGVGTTDKVTSMSSGTVCGE